jgi:hypothetical protein
MSVPILLGSASPLIFLPPPNIENLKIINPPADTVRIRIRCRQGDFPRAYVKTKTGIRQFFLAMDIDGMRLVFEQASNQTVSL